MRRLTLADPPPHVPLEEAGIDSSRPTLLLLNASERAGALGAMLEFFERLESVSHTLVWCEEGEAALRLARVELPRLRLSFEARASSHEPDGGAVAKGGPLLYCLEEPGFFVSNRRDASELMRGLPQSALLENAMGEQLVLLPATAAPLPSAHGCVLRHGDPMWLKALPGVRHYVYPVHPCVRFLSSRTLASSLYLFVARLFSRRHSAPRPTAPQRHRAPPSQCESRRQSQRQSQRHHCHKMRALPPQS